LGNLSALQLKEEVLVFHRSLDASRRRSLIDRGPKFSASLIEALEDRRLLSVSVLHHHHAHKHHTAANASVVESDTTSTATSDTASSSTASADPGSFPSFGHVIDTVEFQDAPTAVQTGLTTLASADSLTTPTATQIVHLGNANGVETYSLDYNTTGTYTRLTVDQNGNAVTAPTQTTTTWADLDGTGTGSDTTAAGEISAIATALNLTAPTSTTVVNVSTPTSGVAIYTVRLASASTSTTDSFGPPDVTISVDANGIPAGNQRLPFSALPTAIQGFLNANVPSGATALASTSTQNVDVRTIDGITTFSTTFTTSGTSTTITVDATGDLITLPTAPTTTTFADIPTPAQTELQTLATADGVTTTISSTQSVSVYAEFNGSTIYSVTLAATNSTTSQTYNITIASDALGNPTVPPNGGFGGGGGGGFGGPGGGFAGGGGDCGPGGLGGGGGGSSTTSAAFASGPFDFTGSEAGPS
jgi:hypothetical protein